MAHKDGQSRETSEVDEEDDVIGCFPNRSRKESVRIGSNSESQWHKKAVDSGNTPEDEEKEVAAVIPNRRQKKSWLIGGGSESYQGCLSR